MMQRSGDGEHILVCVSPSPSNPKVIAAAAKMAEAFQATLTALYVKPADYEELPEAPQNESAPRRRGDALDSSDAPQIKD